MSTILEKIVQSITSHYCTEFQKVFDIFLLHLKGDTFSAKNHQTLFEIQHTKVACYNLIYFSRIITKRGALLVLLMLLFSVFCTPIDAARPKQNTVLVSEKDKKDNSRFPIGCRPVGYTQSLKVLSLFPGREGALQSMYFFFNQLPGTVSLYQMRDKDSMYSTRFNHSIKGNSWAVLATGEPLLKYICTLGDGKLSYGQIVDCAQTIKVCEYVNVKFGLNNKGNFWIVDSNTRNGAVSEVVHYGIIPGV